MGQEFACLLGTYSTYLQLYGNNLWHCSVIYKSAAGHISISSSAEREIQCSEEMKSIMK